MSEQSEQIGELFAALSKMQGELGAVSKDSKGYGYNYASLKSVLDYLREPMEKHGLGITQTNEIREDDRVVVVTTLGHSSGQWIRGKISLPPTPGKRMNVAQAFGSSISYARRYAIMAIVGLASEDDDGESLTQQKPSKNSRNGGTHRRPAPDNDRRPNDYGEPRRQNKPSGRLRAFFDIEKYCPGLNKDYKLQRNDYCAAMIEENGDKCIGISIAEAHAWREAVIHFAREKDGRDWKNMDDHNRGLVLIAESLEKSQDSKAA